ncbi:hypothetical protein PCANC_27189 [Puccinia coronata f. sp. avenae]|uniref:Uncharacterized protein n=1 Tax=Puccinia coronata f. sp. avenae TaxID=200324 RepID=A0A2N5THB1_9BASI|nr:hypothetical protein PCANC_27189 [Puccinia coronata f. sp. avenae]
MSTQPSHMGGLQLDVNESKNNSELGASADSYLPYSIAIIRRPVLCPSACLNPALGDIRFGHLSLHTISSLKGLLLPRRQVMTPVTADPARTCSQTLIGLAFMFEFLISILVRQIVRLFETLMSCEAVSLP